DCRQSNGARAGLIDRGTGEPACARWCCWTDARNGLTGVPPVGLAPSHNQASGLVALRCDSPGRVPECERRLRLARSPDEDLAFPGNSPVADVAHVRALVSFDGDIEPVVPEVLRIQP